MAEATAKKGTASLWQLTRGQRGMFLAALGALFVGTLLMYVAPQIVRISIDGILDSSKRAQQPPFVRSILTSIGADAHPHRALMLAACVIFALTSLGGVFMYLRDRWSSYASEQIARNLRMRLYDHL